MNYLDQPNIIDTAELACKCTAQEAWSHVEALADAALAGSSVSHRALAWQVDHALRISQLRR